MPLSITEDTISHNIVHMTSASKAYIPYFYVNWVKSNKRRSQAAAPVFIVKDTLKQTERKRYPLQNKKKKIVDTYIKRVTHTTESVSINYLITHDKYPSHRIQSLQDCPSLAKLHLLGSP